MYRIGVDIGGMSVKTGIVSEEGKIIKQVRTKTDKNPDIAIKNIAIDIEKLLNELEISKSQVKGIGIGCPGSLETSEGKIIYSNNLGWYDVYIVRDVQNLTGLPVKISNDANVAALGETIYGSAKGYQNAIMITIGTGVGGGIIIDGKIYEGGHSQGAEPGHISLVFDGEPCSCGRRGCVEMYASATALMKQTRNAMLNNKDSLMWKFVDGNIDNVDGRTAFECAKQGDKIAEEVVSKYIAYLSEGLMNTFNLFRPDICILGGGVSAQGDYLINRVTDYCEKNYYGYINAPKTKIIIATLGNDAGIIGSASLIEL